MPQQTHNAAIFLSNDFNIAVIFPIPTPSAYEVISQWKWPSSYEWWNTYKDHFVQRPLRTKETTSYKNPGVILLIKTILCKGDHCIQKYKNFVLNFFKDINCYWYESKYHHVGQILYFVPCNVILYNILFTFVYQEIKKL